MTNQCTLCPRECRVDREYTTGVCGVGNKLKVARAALHFWEEPCISGTTGSGTVFFSGCSLQCVYCQNRQIATGEIGKEITSERLVEIFLQLQEQGAHNINLVTPGHYVDALVPALRLAKAQGLMIPVVYNTGSYEKVESLQKLEGLVDVYLPDFKYFEGSLAKRYSKAPDYPKVAQAAIAEMVRQQPECTFVGEEHPLMTRGVLVRHLMLPGCVEDSKAVLKYLYETYKDQIFISIMSQYTPLSHVADYPELCTKVDRQEYDELVDYAIEIGIENGFIQEEDVAEESFIPSFDCEGV